MTTRRTNADRAEETRTSLMAAGRALFTERRYGDTSTEAIVERAKVIRCALYYHFKDKAALFAAVYDEIESEMVQAILQDMAEAEGDAWQWVVRAVDIFLDLSTAPGVQRVLYVDGPGVFNSPVPNPTGLALIEQSFARLV